MASMHLVADNLFLRLSDKSEGRKEFATVVVTSSLNASPAGAEFPTIRICAHDDEHDKAEARAIFEVSGYEEIDALRRYCEMTLELFRDGRLE